MCFKREQIYKVLNTEIPPPHAASNLKYIRVAVARVHNPSSTPLYIDIKRIINHLNFYQYEKFSYHANREQRENEFR